MAGKYNFDAMGFTEGSAKQVAEILRGDMDASEIADAFWFEETPQGRGFWGRYSSGYATAGQDEASRLFLQEMLDQWNAEHPDTQASDPTSKPTNPKDALGIRKWRQFSCVPLSVLAEIGVGMLEGARKYGPFNWRNGGARSSVYVDAALGHIMQWQEGEDIDPDSGLSHITKAITSLVVLRDAMLQGKMVDDRPPAAGLEALRADLQRQVERIVPAPARVSPASSVAGKTVAFIGTFEHMSRPDHRVRADALGANVTRAVSPEVDCVVAGHGAGAKLRLAQCLGITIVSEDTWMRLTCCD